MCVLPFNKKKAECKKGASDRVGNKKGRIAAVGKISIHPYPSIDNVLFVEGLKHNLLSISQWI